MLADAVLAFKYLRRRTLVVIPYMCVCEKKEAAAFAINEAALALHRFMRMSSSSPRTCMTLHRRLFGEERNNGRVQKLRGGATVFGRRQLARPNGMAMMSRRNAPKQASDEYVVARRTRMHRMPFEPEILASMVTA